MAYRARALAHPLFWASLALLVVNDHVLKGAGVLPGWMTGKLSDFAGLVVAPVLAAAIAGGRGNLRRLAAMLAPAAVFTAIKVSPAAAATLDATMRAMGVPFQTVPDPTDLVALVSLVAAFNLVFSGDGVDKLTSAAASQLVNSVPRKRRSFVERAGVVLGGVACIATSPPPPDPGGDWSTDAFVLNRAGAIDLRIRWIEGSIDCERAESRVAETFARDAFGEGVTFHLEQGATIPLDRNAAGAATFDEDGVPDVAPSFNDCDAALLQAEGMPNTIAFWQRGTFRDVTTSIGDTTDPGTGAVILQRVSGDDGFSVGATTTSGITTESLVDDLEPEECLGAGAPVSFAWSESAQGTGTVTVTALDRAPDGCYALTLSEAGDDLPEFFFVCVPSAAFPFEAGDTIDISHLTTADGQRSLRLTKPGVELLVYSGVTGIDTGTVTGEMVDTECAGDRLDCGAFAIPGAFELTSAGGQAPIVTGGTDEITVGGSRVTIMVGRVERIVLALPECAAGRSTLGLHGDVLILTEEE